MEWVSIVLCILAILLAIGILFFSGKFEVKLMVFMIVLCNIGVVILGRRVVDGFLGGLNYTDLLTNIQQFQASASDISAAAQEDLSESSKQDITTKIDNLYNSISSLADQLSTMDGYNQNTGLLNQQVNSANSAQILQQVDTIKQLQLAKLSDLQTQLNKTQQIVSTQQNAADINKYKPIKIYSSCIVSNADGSYST